MHLMCSICLETFKEPKALPCLHNFCQQCLQDHICNVKVSESSKSNYFECPLCRKKTYPVKPETKRDCWAAEFLTNHFIVSIIDESKKVSTRDSTTERQTTQCVPCEVDGKQEPSSCYCLSCAEYLCRACQKDHKRFKMTRNHTVIEEAQFPNNTDVFKDIACLIQCKEHTDNEVQFKCLVHDTFICSLCASTIHKQCGPVINVDDLNQDTIEDWDMNKTKFASLKESLNAVITNKLVDAEILQNKMASIGASIHTLQESFHHIVEFLQCDVVTQYKEKSHLEARKLSTDIVQCLASMDIMYKANNFVEMIKQHNLSEQQFLYMNSLDNEAEKVKQLLKKFTLTQNEDTFDLIKVNMIALKTKICKWMDQVDSLLLNIKGQRIDNREQDSISVRSIPTASEAQSVSICSDIDKEISKDDEAKAKVSTTKDNETIDTTVCTSTKSAQKISEVDISIPGGPNRISSHTGCVLLKNGNVIFLDHTNQIVKMMDTKLRYKCHVSLKHEPIDVSLIKSDMIAVATSYAVSVFVASSGPKLMKLNDFLFKGIHVLLSICNYGSNLVILQKYKHDNKNIFLQVRTKGNKMSRIVRKRDYCLCENKGADQLRGNREADQRLCFRYTDSTISLLLKSEISSF